MPSRNPLSSNLSHGTASNIPTTYVTVFDTTPTYDVKVDFSRPEHATLEHVEGRRAIAVVSSPSEVSVSELAQTYVLPLAIKRAVTQGVITVKEWEDALFSISLTHGCQNPYCALTAVSKGRLEAACTALRTAAGEAFHTYRVRLAVPDCQTAQSSTSEERRDPESGTL